MEHFKRWNNIAGWTTFVIAAVVYLLCLEPTVSYWDCGEFISCSYKLEIGHPPGAPLFLMMAKVFSLLAPNPAKVAVMINAMSALTSAFTVLFLFWTISHLARKLLVKDNEITTGKLISILGAGLVGSLAFAFSDSFWFSAVEAEVYGTSSFFTAVVFWAILKWEEAYEKPYANRWIILIAYLMGLSIGVHLLNLLTIPAITLVFYFKKFKPTVVGIIFTTIVSFFILVLVQYGFISGLIKLAAKTELFFVNSLHFPFNSGAITFGLSLFALLILGLWFAYRYKKVVLHTIFLACTVILMGYGSYAMVIIRSNANTPLNENRPDNMFSLLYYLNREQYGESPLLFGPYYNAPTADLVSGEPTFTKEHGRYVPVDSALSYTYDPRFITFFPRMYGRNQSHVEIYKEWANIKGTPVTVTRDGKQMVDYKPTFKENLTFFFKYQIGYMYLRYFMWNFAGRQNEIDGDGGILNGNWITGFNFIDSKFVGPQDKLPTHYKENKGRNKYYLLPLLLGIMGIIYQLLRSKRNFYVTFLLFFMTGIAIVIYLNQTPLQPRERDYSYVGSFYAFAIWIGLGVLFVAEVFEKFLNKKNAAIVATAICLLAVPALMACQNWDDHNRSGRYTAHDVAYNYLNSCAPNAILFTDGDNDTFPLWYLQEVEGIRTDVRVVNTVLLSSDWYIDQLKQKVNDSAPLPISIPSEKYLSRRRDYVYLIGSANDHITLLDAVAHATSDDPKDKTFPGVDFTMEYIPAKNFTLPVDTQKVKTNGTVNPEMASEIVPEINFTLNRNYISKTELLVMNILSHNNWNRPIYFGSPNSEGVLGLQEYLQMEGSAYRLVPIKTMVTGKFAHGRIETNILYHNLMEVFRWGNMNKPGVYIDNYNVNNYSFLRTRLNFARLALQLYNEGKNDSTTKVLNRCIELMPVKIYPHDIYSLELADIAYQTENTKLANQLLQEYANQCLEEIRFFYAMPLWQFNLTQTENIIAQQTVQQLANLAGKYDEDGLKKKLEQELKRATNK